MSRPRRQISVSLDGAWDPAWKGWWGEDPPLHVRDPGFEPIEVVASPSVTHVKYGVAR